MPSQAGALATRAVGQYRSRDVFPYVHLRLHLTAEAARSDQWARTVGVDHIIQRKSSKYLEARHFKSIGEGDSVETRDMHFPVALECLAESVLVDEVSRLWKDLSRPSVFSYRPTSHASKSIYSSYLDGLRARDVCIERAIREIGKGAIVHSVDVKSFYPSIHRLRALEDWQKTMSRVGLSKRLILAGQRLIEGYPQTPRAKGLVIGPMFTHLIGNMVMRSVDDALGAQQSVWYGRYVDDITLVGRDRELKDVLSLLTDSLDGLGLKLQEVKTTRLRGEYWLRWRHDFRESEVQRRWKRFVHLLKGRLLMARNEEQEHIGSEFREQEFRIPFARYREDVREAKYALNVIRRAKWYLRTWLSVKGETRELVQEARLLRQLVDRELEVTLEEYRCRSDDTRTFLVPRLRYLAGRALVLSNRASLQRWIEAFEGISHLYIYRAIMRTVIGGDVGHVIPLGTNVCRVAGQILASTGEPEYHLNADEFGEIHDLAATAMLLQGVKLNCVNPRWKYADLVLHGGGQGPLREEGDSYFRDLASLCRGSQQEESRMLSVARSAFSVEETLSLDMLDQIGLLSA